jgi:hypothetical protein
VREQNVHVDHAYASNTSDGDALALDGYRFDGIEGFLLPAPVNKNTIAVYRARNAVIDDWAVFPQSELAAMQAAGYDESAQILGYAYANSGVQPSL